MRYVRVIIVATATAMATACGLSLTGTAGDDDTTPPTTTDAGADRSSLADGAQIVDGSPRPDAPGPKVCPSLNRGPKMVRVDTFCIDSTEVTLGQYKAFLATNPPISALPAECTAWKTTHMYNAPGFNNNNNYAVVGVDFCDAIGFCAWAGKRLCGQRSDGGALPFIPTPHGANVSEWSFACSKNGAQQWPYGATFEPGRCNDSNRPENGPLEAGALPGCQGGFPGIFDMAGSVFEYENTCNPDSGRCRVRGGSFMHNGSGTVSCNGIYHQPFDAGGGADTGFRCCATPQ